MLAGAVVGPCEGDGGFEEVTEGQHHWRHRKGVRDLAQEAEPGTYVCDSKGDCVEVFLAWFDIGEGDVEPGKFHLVLGEAEFARVQGDPILGTHVHPLGGLMERCLDVGRPK